MHVIFRTEKDHHITAIEVPKGVVFRMLTDAALNPKTSMDDCLQIKTAATIVSNARTE